MNLEYKSGRRLMDARFIESILGGINIISEIFDFVLLWNCVRFNKSDEHCTVLSGQSRLYKALGIEEMFASIIRKCRRISEFMRAY